MGGSSNTFEHLREYREALRVDPSTFRSVRNLALFVVIEQILFLPLDWQVLHDAFGTFLIIRLAILSSAAYIAIRACSSHPIESSIVMELQSGAMIVAMIAHDGGMTSRYCPGLVLTFCALPVFVPLSVRQVSISVLPSLLAFLLLPLITAPLTGMDYGLSAVFPVSGAMIALGSTWVLDNVRFAEFLRRKELEEARDHLKALDAAKSRFTANVHHELRTPLTLILAPLEAMLEASFGAVPPMFAPHLESMRSNALRLLKLINNLLDLAKLESNQMTIRRRPLALGQVVDEIVQGAAGLADRKGVRLLTKIAEDLPSLSADRDALEKVLVNLIGNALKFTESGGTIELSAKSSTMGIRIVVSDTGIGIPPDQLERIFDRFAQVDTSATRKHEGTGIGLSLVRELVELHGGRVWATSGGPGHGAQMHIDLPMGSQDEDESEAVVEGSDGRSLGLQRAFHALSADSIASEPTQPDYKLADLRQNVDRWTERNQGVPAAPAGLDTQDERQRVLVVEDNPDMRRLLTALLGDEFQVRTACNGREGLEKVREERPDVILSDVMMPEMSGLELCNAVKSDPSLRTVPFLLVTSKADREMRVEGLELGADDYVTKPFHPRELLARVRSFARLRGLQEELTHRNADLELALDKLKAAQSQLVHQEKMASLGQLVAGIAHEINNPVHFIQGNLDFLEQAYSSLMAERSSAGADAVKIDETLSSDLASIFSGIREGVARTVRIVADLRTFSRLDRAEIIEINLAESLDATLNLLRARLRTIDVVREYGDLPPVACLSGQLNQVFMNLVVNAVDAVGDGGRIVIRTGAIGDTGAVFVEVEDNGCGMPPEVLEHIFDPFFTTKEIGKGTGLGLSVSHGIIERHGGRIQVSSEVGRGSRFRVEIPATLPPVT